MARDLEYKVIDWSGDLITEADELAYEIAMDNWYNVVEYCVPYICYLYNVSPWDCLRKFYDSRVPAHDNKSLI